MLFEQMLKEKLETLKKPATKQINSVKKNIKERKTDFSHEQFMKLFSVNVNPKNFLQFFSILVKQKTEKTENTRER